MKSKDDFKNNVKIIAHHIVEDSPYIRFGQAVFNYVDEKYKVARTTQFEYGIDCFYDDSKVDDFLNKCYDLIKKDNKDD